MSQRRETNGGRPRIFIGYNAQAEDAEARIRELLDEIQRAKDVLDRQPGMDVPHALAEPVDSDPAGDARVAVDAASPAAPAPRLHRAPGSLLLRAGEFLFSRAAYESVIEPTIHDLWHEYAEALAQNRVWKARWVRIRGYVSFARAAGLQVVLSAGRTLLGFPKVGGS